MIWLELSVEASRDAVESLSELFHRYGHGGVAVEERIIPQLEGAGYELDFSRPVVVRTYLPQDEKAVDVRRQVEEALWHLGRIVPIGSLNVVEVKEEDWAENWKAHYQVLRIGQRIVVKPSWREYTPASDDIVLELDPGMAFGTGLHATTRSCLAAIERILGTSAPAVPTFRPADALDLGTGSGILAIAAAKFGVPRVIARDLDQVAVAAAAANAARNGLDAVITAECASLLPGEQYDLILANIIAGVLINLSVDLRAALRPGGVLIASGIIDHRLDEVRAAFGQAGLRVDETIADGDWRSLMCR